MGFLVFNKTAFPITLKVTLVRGELVRVMCNWFVELHVEFKIVIVIKCFATFQWAFELFGFRGSSAPFSDISGPSGKCLGVSHFSIPTVA